MLIGRNEGYWVTPFVMAGTNMKAVRRSASLLNYNQDGESFSNFEAMASFSLLEALSKLKTFILFALIMYFRVIGDYAIKKKYLFSPGEGPSERQMDHGRFVFRVVGIADTKPAQRIACVVSGGDPGYRESSKMLSESAFCVALQKDQFTGLKGGVLTPASSMGMILVERLRKAGLKFEMDTGNQSRM